MEHSQKISVKEIMTKSVVVVTPDTPLLEAFQTMIQAGYSGLPVIDDKRVVVGIVTDYDLLTKANAIHLPTFIKLFGELPTSIAEGQPLKRKMTDAPAVTVKAIMNHEPLLMKEEDSLAAIVQAFSEHHRVNPIPVIDSSGKLTGIVSRFDIIKFYANVLKDEMEK